MALKRRPARVQRWRHWHLSLVQSVTLPLGKLSVHDEFPDSVAETIKPFFLDPAG